MDLKSSWWRLGLVGAFLAVAAFVLTTTPAQAADPVTVGGQTHAVDGVNVYRSSNFLVKYTPAKGATTGTNAYGFEAAVVGGKVTAIQNAVGNMAIPANGFVLSGHGTSATWLRTYAKVGVTVTEGSTSPPSPTSTATATATSTTTPPPGGTPETAKNVTISGPAIGVQTRVINANNARRLTDQLIRYTAAWGARTGQNAYGYEAEVIGGKVTRVENAIGNMAIPASGYVLSGHGTSATWLRNYARVGMTARLDTDGQPEPSPTATATATATTPTTTATPTPTAPPTTGTPRLPDIRVHKLDRSSSQDPSGRHGFSIVTSGGAKLLKFPAITANVGDGPLEIRGTRSSTTATDWVGRQILTNTDGTTTTLGDSGASFYFAGDGHNHWHIRDFDRYELLDATGTQLKLGEKHGFCFEDNTSRDSTWTQQPSGPQPANPVYTNAASCGNGQPNATSITHGLSVGWADTYPSSLPDQAINITGIPDGTYTVKVTADWQGFWQEKNDGNNTATSKVTITGNNVAFVSADTGL